MEQEKNECGRPTKYKPEFATMVYKLCLGGFTNAKIADVFEVNVDTLNEWQKKHPSFYKEMRRGKDEADAEIAHALYNRAKGYSYEEISYERVSDRLTIMTLQTEQVTKDPYKIRVTTKHLPADPGSCMSWLSNRQREHWRIKQDFSIDLNSCTDEQLDALLLRAQNLATQ